MDITPVSICTVECQLYELQLSKNTGQLDTVRTSLTR